MRRSATGPGRARVTAMRRLRVAVGVDRPRRAWAGIQASRRCPLSDRSRTAHRAAAQPVLQNLAMVRGDLRPTIEALLGRFDLCLVRSPEDAARFGALGAPRISTTGNLKLDVPPPPADAENLKALAHAIGQRPVIAATSKVIRNVLTRLHADIMRTTTHYRSQQGGSAPTMVLLAGGTAGLPFIREFFAEKLNIPTDYFNALRNVSLAGGLDPKEFGAQSHMMGELVGLAASRTGNVPFALTLQTDAVIEAKKLAKRKPYLVAATGLLAATLGALGFYYSRGAALADQRSLESQNQRAKIQGVQKEIDDLLAKKRLFDDQKKPYVDAVQLRAFWVILLNSLHQSFETDMMWFTVLEPLSQGEPVTVDLEELAKNNAADTAAGVVDNKVGTKQNLVVDAIRIRGLYRSGPESKGAQMVFSYVEKLAALPFFDLKDKAINDFVKQADTGGTDAYAHPFMFELPLVEAAKFSFSK